MGEYVKAQDIKTETKNKFYEDTSPKYIDKLNAVAH